jgi:hypothetical protein
MGACDLNRTGAYRTVILTFDENQVHALANSGILGVGVAAS